MKKHNKGWTTKYVCIICLAVVTVVLCISGSFAAYTNFSSARRVVSVKAGSKLLFSSNMLFAEYSTTPSTSYQRKRIALTDTNEFVVEIYNYNPADASVYSEQDIAYQLRATVTSANGADYKITYDGQEYSFSNVEGSYVAVIEGSLPGSESNVNSFKFKVPEADKDGVAICVEAIPTDYSVTDQRKLAAVIASGELLTQKTWAGKFLDQKLDGEGPRTPDSYDGFNYEISGNGAGTVTVEWNSSELTINPWFASEVGGTITETGNKKKISFSVGGDGQPPAYQTQFFKAKSWNTQNQWSDLEDLVKVNYVKSVE